MAKFAYNNAKNAKTGYTSFELNCDFNNRAFYKKKVDLYFQSKLVYELATELKELMATCKEILQHIEKLQKQYNDKHVKPRNYVPGNIVWLNSKYIKTKQNRKLEAKFFGSFWVLHPVGKQAY